MLIFRPFIYIMEQLYRMNFQVTGHYGWSLILLSLEVTLILFPLMFLAESWKHKEERIQKKMSPYMDSVKEKYQGQKRYYLIREIHRIYHYHSLYSLRVSFGLLIQIPFFLAAYQFLSHYEPFRGISFGPLSDLAAMDSLLFGLSLMPFLMTAVNLTGSFIYTRGQKFSEKLSFILMALLFLILLYDRPSGLVLYWTFNNIFAIPKNLWFKKKFPHIEKSDAKSLKEMLQGPGREWLPVVLALLYWSISLFLLDRFYYQGKYVLFLSLIITALLGFLFLFHLLSSLKKGSGWPRGIIPLIVFTLCYLYLLADSYTHGYLERRYSVESIRALILSLDSVILFLLLRTLLLRESQKIQKLRFFHGWRNTEPQIKRNIWIPLVSWGVFFLILAPLGILAHGSEELGFSPGELLYHNGSLLILYMLVAAAVTLIWPRKKNLAVMALSLWFLSLLYYFVLPSDFGMLDVNILMEAEKLKQIPLVVYLLDGILFILMGFLLRKGVEGGSKFLPRLASVLLLLLTVQTGYQWLNNGAVQSKDENTPVSMIQESDPVHRFSRNNPNILIVVPDMFSGGYMEMLMDEDPQWLNRYSGFTWFANCLSTSFYTVTSMPALIGGPEYDALALNQKPGMNRDKGPQAYEELFLPLINNGCDISMVDPELLPSAEHLHRFQIAKAQDYYPRWKETNHFSEDEEAKEFSKPILTLWGLFQSAPYSLKNGIYANGNWAFIPKAGLVSQLRRRVRKDWAYFDLLPEVSTVDEGQPTVKYIHSLLTHIPYAIDSEGRILEKGYPDPAAGNYEGGMAAYYSAKEFLHVFSRWIEWMKEEGVYDNTLIILVSDHGNAVSANNPLQPEDIEEILGSPEMFNRANPLLMVKGFGERGALQSDYSSFTSNGDITSIIHAALEGREFSVEENRSLTFNFLLNEHRQYPLMEKGDFRVWEISDSIFESSNWQEISD